MLHAEQGYQTRGDYHSLQIGGDLISKPRPATSFGLWAGPREKMMEIKANVKEWYGQAALRVTTGGRSCCGAIARLDGCSVEPITSNLHDANQTGQIPEEAVLASLGRGNPTALGNLNAGETVLDLGSGGGIDVLLSARRVGPSGKA
jgi:arsenite methyltransferase